MALRRIAQSWFLLCLLFFAAAQSTGVGAVFLCLCSGHAFVTTSAECHGPHGEHCVTVDDAHECGDEPCNTEQHATVTGKIKTLRMSQTHAPDVTLDVVERVLSFSELLRVRPACAPPIVRHDQPSPPTLGVAVAQTIVLRI